MVQLVYHIKLHSEASKQEFRNAIHQTSGSQSRLGHCRRVWGEYVKIGENMGINHRLDAKPADQPAGDPQEQRTA